MQFRNVIGQETIKAQLVHMVQQNRLSHALLFLGREGAGSLPLAMAFAQYIVCRSANSNTSAASLFDNATPVEPPPADACGVCTACLKAAQLTHPDIHFSYPVITKKAGEKPVSTDFIQEWRTFVAQQPYGNIYDWLQSIDAENKQGNITANECNDIIRKLNLKSFESEYKILIMWMPEFLGKEGNKLLKLIEEPPANTLFILVAENESQILPTILSRTQLVKVPALEDTAIEAALKTLQVEPEKARQIASVSEGNYREALQLLQHAEDDWNALLREWLNAILKTGPAAQVKWIEEMSRQGREKQKQFLRYFTHLLEQALRLRAIPAVNNRQAGNEADIALRLNKLCSLAQQEAIVAELDKAAYHIERNAHPKMLFHALSIRLYHIISNNSLILVN